MTREEFDSTNFCASMSVIYQGRIYLITGVDFVKFLLKLSAIDYFGVDGDFWARCEDVILNK